MTHHPDAHAHAPVLFKWKTSLERYGIDRTPDMTAAGRMIRAARDDCDECLAHWARHVAKGDPLVVVHLAGSAWTRCHEAGIDPGSIFRADAWTILTPMLHGQIPQMVQVADAMSPPRLLEVLDDALSILRESPAVLLEEARHNPIVTDERHAS